MSVVGTHSVDTWLSGEGRLAVPGVSWSHTSGERESPGVWGPRVSFSTALRGLWTSVTQVRMRTRGFQPGVPPN